MTRPALRRCIESRNDQRFADHVPLGEASQSRSGLREREPVRDPRHERPLGVKREEVLEHRLDGRRLGGEHAAEADPEHREALEEQPLGGHARDRAAREADDEEAPVARRRAQRLLEDGAPDRIEDDLRAAASREPVSSSTVSRTAWVE